MRVVRWVVGVAIVAACGTSSLDELDPEYSYSPKDAVRTCTLDGDCAVVEYIGNCGTCCSRAAVTHGAGDKDYQAALAACRESDAPPSENCAIGCPGAHASCFEGTCVLVQDTLTPDPDPFSLCLQDAGPKVDGGVPSELETGPRCGATVVRNDFENGLDPSWALTEPSALQIDRSAPINGAASLRISYRQEDAFFAIPQPNACAVRLAFTLRTKLMVSGLNLGRIVAGDGSWFHLLVSGCALSVSEEIDDGVARGGGPLNLSWPVPDESAVRVVLTLDLRSRTISGTAAPIGQPLPAPQSSGFRGKPSGIRSIELGSTHGYVSGALGSVWLDDLAID